MIVDVVYDSLIKRSLPPGLLPEIALPPVPGVVGWNKDDAVSFDDGVSFILLEVRKSSMVEANDSQLCLKMTQQTFDYAIFAQKAQ